MHSILILNAKGGCGKTTIATNLAGYYASKGKSVTLADFDPQGSSIDWLAVRPETAATITGVKAYEQPLRTSKDIDYLIMDAPAGVHGRTLTDLVRRAETIILPILPSPMDIRAASHFIKTLKDVKKVVRQEVKITTVANRVRENTLVALDLDDYLGHQKLPDGKKMPFITMLRGTQNYIRAAQRGLSIFEFAPAATDVDRETWKPLLRWLNSVRSRP